jgi:excisionase family DNA binding protein
MSKKEQQNGATRKVSSAGTATPATAQANDRVEILVNGVRIEVSPVLEAAVRRACEVASKPVPAEMTTTQAADFLDVSRPFVIKLINRGELPCRMVGKHRRIPTDALRKYRENMLRCAAEAATEMTRLSQEMGLYDLEGPPPKAR